MTGSVGVGGGETVDGGGEAPDNGEQATCWAAVWQQDLGHPTRCALPVDASIHKATAWGGHDFKPHPAGSRDEHYNGVRLPSPDDEAPDNASPSPSPRGEEGQGT